MESFMLLGLGYTGKRIYETLISESYLIHAFSAHTRFPGTFILNASEPQAVPQISDYLEKFPVKHVVITFPPQAEHLPLFRILSEKVEHRLLMSTTSVYEKPGIIREDSPKAPGHKRLPIEEIFIREGGKVLRLPGIYGPGRNPADWYKRKPDKELNRQLNLIHVEDIVGFIRLWIQRPAKNSVINLSDGQIHTWGDIGQYMDKENVKTGFNDAENAFSGQIVENKLVRELYPELTFKKFTLYMENQLFGK